MPVKCVLAYCGVLITTTLAAVSMLLAADPPSASGQKEESLISTLQSQVPPQEKAIACKQLAVYGGKNAVPALAALLPNAELSSWARIALEVIPDPAAGAALREALGKTQGRLLVGIINSLGVRRDATAIDDLLPKLKDANVEVASAAAEALGAIGGEKAAQALEGCLTSVPSQALAAVAEGCVLCAENFLAQGKANAAIKLYDAVRQAKAPKNKILEATRGAILARKSAGLPLLIEQLKSSDKGVFSMGLRVARELPGEDITKAIAVEFERMGPDRQALLVLALADRTDPAVLPVVRRVAQQGLSPVRLAAIGALERMGNASCVPVLLEAAASDDRAIAEKAQITLTRLSGKEVDADLLARLPQSSGKTRLALISLAGERRIDEALPIIERYVEDPDAGVRQAAVSTLGTLGQAKQSGILTAFLRRTQDPRERSDGEKALLSISSRVGRDCWPHVAPLVKQDDAALRIIGLHAFAIVGGSEALATVKSALNDKEETVQDEAVRTLASWANHWPDDAAVAEPLLDLARSGKKTAHRVLGARGYLQYLQGEKKLDDNVKVAKIKDLLPLISRSEEKRLGISVLSAIPTAPALELLMGFTSDTEVAEDAFVAIVNLAKNDVKGASKELRTQSLQTVIDKSKDNQTRKKAEDALKKIG